jgi:galactose mutarotase-like enzyme
MDYAVFAHTNDIDEIRGPEVSIKLARCGAELFSLKLNHPEFGPIGILLNDDEASPDHPWWNSHAPLLFPIVGGLVNNVSRLRDGTQISLKNHGFARKTMFTKKAHGLHSRGAWIEYGIDESSITPGSYPWKFIFRVRYELSGKSLKVTMSVVNNDTTAMWYQFGWHPGFKTPFVPGRGSTSDVRLLLPEGMHTIYECDENSFLTGRKERRKLGGAFDRTSEGLARTYVFDMSEINNRSAALVDPNSGIGLTLSFADFPHLGVWSDGPFICMEPWQGCDDYANQTVFEDKFGIVSLAPGKSDTREIVLSVNSAPS